MDETGDLFRPRAVLSVAELNLQVRQQIERSFPLLWVGGEISNFVRATSEHWYFTLKDAKSQVRCAMFRNRNQLAEWIPGNGDAVEVNALVTLYEARGEYQLIIETIRRAGLGALYEKFLKVKAQLESQGWFDPARKRSLPEFPKQIGIITSPAAAALYDVLSILKRRAPNIPIVFYPTAVQGNGSAAALVQAIRNAGARAECDVLILCRGGGSIEDLWSFNEEIVARAILACPIPVIVGVGHETDFTIADFVADERAPTPTAAAQRVAPDRGDLRTGLLQLERRANDSLQRFLQGRSQRLDHLAQRLIHPGARLRQQQQQLNQLTARLRLTHNHRIQVMNWKLQHLQQRVAVQRTWLQPVHERISHSGVRLVRALRHTFARRSADLQRLAGNFHHLNPTKVMERGYSVVRNGAGAIVKSGDQITIGEDLRLSFASGAAVATVKEKNPHT